MERVASKSRLTLARAASPARPVSIASGFVAEVRLGVLTQEPGTVYALTWPSTQ